MPQPTEPQAGIIDGVRDRVSAAVRAGAPIELSPSDLRMMVQLGFDAWLLSAAQAEEALNRDRRPPLDKPIYKPSDLAERWGISNAAVLAAIKSGRLVAFKLGVKMYRVRRDEVERYEAGGGGASRP